MTLSTILASILLSNPLVPASKTSPEAFYTIPASAEQGVEMTFAFEEVQLESSNTAATLEFRLPALLDGRNGQKFILNGKILDSRIILNGDGAKASCDVDVSLTECQISFTDLKLNHSAAELVELESGASVLSEQLKLTREMFEHQAVGTITFVTK